MYAKIKDNQVVDVSVHKTTMFNIPFSGKLNNEELKALHILPIQDIKPTVTQYQDLVEESRVIDGDKVVRTYRAVNKDPKDVKDMKLKEGFVWNNLHVDCSAESIAMLSIHQNRIFEWINLKLGGSFIECSKAEYLDLLELIAEFVQGCFDDEMNQNEG